jgi:hypothetical protein
MEACLAAADPHDVGEESLDEGLGGLTRQAANSCAPPYGLRRRGT